MAGEQVRLDHAASHEPPPLRQGVDPPPQANSCFGIVMSAGYRKVLIVLRVFLGLLALGVVLTIPALADDASDAPRGRIKKVLPLLLDAKGRYTVSPSPFDRDAYQAHLRQNAAEVTGIRYDVRWMAAKAQGRTLTVRLELRGLYEGEEPSRTTLETFVVGSSTTRKWTILTLEGDEFVRFGKVTAWRASLWCDGEILDEYKSFLW